MGMKVGLDTNIFLNVKNKEKAFYKYSKAILKAVEKGKITSIVSIITIAELSTGYHQEKEIKEKNEFFAGLYSNNHYNIVELDFNLADKSGELRSQINLKLPDCIIIASCMQEGATCLITNDGDFDGAEKLKIFDFL